MTQEQIEKYRQALDAMRGWKEGIYHMYTCCHDGRGNIELGVNGHGTWEVRINGRVEHQNMQVYSAVEYYNSLVSYKHQIGL